MRVMDGRYAVCGTRYAVRGCLRRRIGHSGGSPCTGGYRAPRTAHRPSMTRVLLVPDLPLERWPSMDRYAHRLHDWLEGGDPGFEVRLAASIGDLTRDVSNGRSSGG